MSGCRRFCATIWIHGVFLVSSSWSIKSERQCPSSWLLRYGIWLRLNGASTHKPGEDVTSSIARGAYSISQSIARLVSSQPYLSKHKEIMVCSLQKTCEIKTKYQLCTKAPFVMMIDMIMIAVGFIICWLIFPLTRSISDNFHTSPIMYFIFRAMFSVGIPYVVVKFIM